MQTGLEQPVETRRHNGEKMKKIGMKLVAGMLLAASYAIAAEEPALGSAEELRGRLAAMNPDAQCDWLVQSMGRQQLAKASDAQLTAILQSLESTALFCPVKRMVEQTPEYEFLMVRRERVKESDSLPDKPQRVFVRMRQEPLTVYARWEKDGALAGQEVLYDAGKDSRNMLAHSGGLLGLISMNIPIDGSLAKANSRHTVRALGVAYILAQLEADHERNIAAKRSTKPASVKVARDGGKRYAEVVYDNPGMPPYYAKQSRFWLDLSEPVIRMVESRDNKGEVFEHMVFESLERKKLAPNAFDPKNPEYRF